MKPKAEVLARAGAGEYESDVTATILASALQPGDGTRYELRLIDRADESLFVWLNAPKHSRAMRLPKHDDRPHPDYIAEKMDIRDYEAEIFAAWLVGVL